METKDFLFFVGTKKGPQFVWQKHRDRLQNHPRKKEKKKNLTVIPNFLLTEIWQQKKMTTYTLKISSCVHTFSNRILTFTSSVLMFPSYIHTFSNGGLTFISSIDTVTSRFHTFSSDFTRCHPEFKRSHTEFTLSHPRVLTFSSSGHTFASIGLVGCELGSSLLFYWQIFAKKRNEMKKIGIFFYFGTCQSPEVIKNSVNRQISAVGFQD
jgi:hypothetical protein